MQQRRQEGEDGGRGGKNCNEKAVSAHGERARLLQTWFG
jgi:hypothetical protein